jgi:hypothetical protein
MRARFAAGRASRLQVLSLASLPTNDHDRDRDPDHDRDRDPDHDPDHDRNR